MIDPYHLIEVARELSSKKWTGWPLRTALRRSISTSYYALFHFLLMSAADLLIARRERDSSRYNLVYRSLEHGRIKSVCIEVSKPASPYAFGTEIRQCAMLFVELQDSRHKADYDPAANFTVSGARAAITKAQDAIAHLKAAPEVESRLFLTLLHFRPRV